MQFVGQARFRLEQFQPPEVDVVCTLIFFRSPCSKGKSLLAWTHKSSFISANPHCTNLIEHDTIWSDTFLHLFYNRCNFTTMIRKDQMLCNRLNLSFRRGENGGARVNRLTVLCDSEWEILTSIIVRVHFVSQSYIYSSSVL